MALQFSTTLRTNMVGQIQTTAGSSGVTCNIYTGSEPANCAAAESGTLLVSMTLPATFLTAASGVASLTGTWSANATATGTAGHFRILSGSTVVLQGDCVSDMVLQNTSIASGQAVSVSSFAITQGNA